MSLMVQDLIRHYGGVKALDGVSFEVLPGQCVALIGPTALASPPVSPVWRGSRCPIPGTWSGMGGM